jgi:hypothetical protein
LQICLSGMVSCDPESAAAIFYFCDETSIKKYQREH